MSNFTAGDRVPSRCTRCKDVTNHIVMALVDGAIAKVECCACKSVHRYLPPEGTPKKSRVQAGDVVTKKNGQIVPVRAPKSTPAKSAPVKSATKLQKAAETLEAEWIVALNKSALARKPYSMDQTYALGEVVDHPSFGYGIINECIEPDKIRVLFRDGVRLLRTARS